MDFAKIAKNMGQSGTRPSRTYFSHTERSPTRLQDISPLNCSTEEEWTGPEQGKESTISFLLSVYERLETARDLANEVERKSKKKMKEQYDRGTKERAFEVGELVLILLPTSTNKLVAKWMGPYPITERLGKTTYRVRTGSGAKGIRVFHINMMSRWESPSAVCLLAQEDDDLEKDEDFPSWDDQGSKTPTINPDLTPKQTKEMEELVQKFSPTFSNTPGRITEGQISIETGTAKPVNSPPYRIPHSRIEIAKGLVKQLLQAGLIKESRSSWASRAILVSKKDGTLRLCADYRKLNEVTESSTFPMPRIDDLIDGLAGARYISALDLTKGYWQIPVAEKDIPKTAFTVPFGRYEYKVMPFGLVGAPATFQRIMNEMLGDLPQFAAAYLDDVVVFSTNWDDHVKHLETVLLRIRKSGLTLKAAKCNLGMEECEYLGHQVGRGVIKPLQAKIAAILEFKRPQTKINVRAFLGLRGYYRKFVENFSTIAAPLSDLTRKENPEKVRWKQEHQEAFDELKRRLSSDPVLQGPNYDKEFVIDTDASKVGVGAVLCQENDEDPDGPYRPVAFFSKKLLPRETKYATVERECLAIVKAVKHFQVYVTGTHFTIRTDHNCLKFLKNMKDIGGRLTRWSLILQPFDMMIIHRPGRLNGNADALSRQDWDDPGNDPREEMEECQGPKTRPLTT